MTVDRPSADIGDGALPRGQGALEPELDWNAIVQGRAFREVPLDLDGDAIDAYLAVTGESYSLYEEGRGGLAPPLYTTLVRFAKAALGGRWPSGTIQLDHRIAWFRPLRRGERLTIDALIRTAETRNGRSYFETVSVMRDCNRVAVGEQASTSMWAGALPGTTPAAPGRSAARPVSAARDPQSSLPTQGASARIGPVAGRFSLSMVRDFGRVAGALDPIHVDPDFARGTRYGDNVVQGRLAMTLIARLMLEHRCKAWLDRGELTVHFRKPLFVDQSVSAWGAPLPADRQGFVVWCENERGERIIEGVARIGAVSPADSLSNPD
jgi:3-hydroxybutyryl-CoA dehydratase